VAAIHGGGWLLSYLLGVTRMAERNVACGLPVALRLAAAPVWRSAANVAQRMWPISNVA